MKHNNMSSAFITWFNGSIIRTVYRSILLSRDEYFEYPLDVFNSANRESSQMVIKGLDIFYYSHL